MKKKINEMLCGMLPFYLMVIVVMLIMIGGSLIYLSINGAPIIPKYDIPYYEYTYPMKISYINSKPLDIQGKIGITFQKYNYIKLGEFEYTIVDVNDLEQALNSLNMNTPYTLIMHSSLSYANNDVTDGWDIEITHYILEIKDINGTTIWEC